MSLVRANKEKILPLFLLHLLKSEEAKEYFRINANTTTNISNLTFESLNAFEIPLPPLEIQQQIVAEIESYQKIIDGARMVVENYKPTIKINPEWEMVELGKICEKISDSIDPQKQSGVINYVGLENIEQNSGNLVGETITEYSTIKSTKINFQTNNLLYGKLRPNLNKVWLAKTSGICSTDFFVLKFNTPVADEKFYSYYFLSKNFNDEVMNGIKGAQLPRVTYDYFSQIKVPFPPIDEQTAIMQQIEEEQKMVESSKKLIALFEQKIKDRIGEVWGEKTN